MGSILNGRVVIRITGVLSVGRREAAYRVPITISVGCMRRTSTGHMYAFLLKGQSHRNMKIPTFSTYSIENCPSVRD